MVRQHWSAHESSFCAPQGTENPRTPSEQEPVGQYAEPAACGRSLPGSPVSVTATAPRNLLLDLSERAEAFRFLVRDRAGQFTAAFDTVLAAADITVLTIPASCPRANAYAERFVFTARTELTDRILISGRHHLQHVLAEYARHYNRRRPHRGRQLRPPRPDQPIPALPAQRISRRTVLGGLINEYQPAA